MSDAIGRRSVLLGMVATGAFVATGCGGGSSADTAGATGAGTASGSGAASPSASTGGTDALATVADIPVGSAVSAQSPDGTPLIISRPSTDAVVGFSAVCTHQGCTVAPAGKELDCPCHGSRYDVATGKVLGGPAPAPLHPFQVKVENGQVFPA